MDSTRLQAVENLDTSKEADRSKPYVANLEASYQLEESSSGESGARVVIDATPLPLRKKRGRDKVKAKDEVGYQKKKENKEPVSDCFIFEGV